MLTVVDISRSDRNSLHDIKTDLVTRRMEMDKYFSEFLEKTELRETDLDTPEWNHYRTKTSEYANLMHLIRTTEYYLNHGK